MRGVLAAVPTPVSANGDPDTARFLRHARWCLENGCDGLNVLGTTGEANSFSKGQRLAVMEAAAKGLDTSRLMVGTGTPDLATTIELTCAARDLGYAGALVLPPYYYKGVSDDGLFDWFNSVIAATAGIRVYLYNFPQMTGLPLSPALVRRLAEVHPDRLVGAKDSSGDLSYAADIASIDGFDVFPSDESALAAAGQKGFAGCISATVNLTAPLAAGLWRNHNDETLASAVRAARRNIAAQPLIPAVKHLVAQLHGDLEFERLLPPHLPLTEVQKQSLAATMAA
ncbi:MAG: dihydrodipicolinate synthase family protein [Rhizobiaceae bacterium]|nr:dihydrodipicolinate synthase family protein [Rhizobiaceae bacterium]